jgi:hypothetical protein
MHHGDGAAPGALARHQPVAQAVIHRAFADAGFFQPRGDFRLGLFHRHAVEKARIGQLAGAGIGLACRLSKLLGSASDGTTTGVTASPYLRAKSRSRWSCAGQPKIAPVP